MKPLVVKLGGSTAGHVQMQRWIDILAGAGFPLVIVPGGGPFAEQVRISQKPLAYSGDAAHAMAILAMDQFGIAIAERHPRLQVARSLAQIDEVLDAGSLPVWLPSTMALGAPDIPCSWDLTSDSLSAWLARLLTADDLLLVKQTDEYVHYATVRELADAGIADRMLPDMLGEGTSLHVAGPHVLEELRAPLASVPGRRMIRYSYIEAMGAQ